jgi:hypothetical protein
VSSIANSTLVGCIAGGFFFICGLPSALVGSFIHSEVSYAQDRADYRQMLSDMEIDMRAEEHELLEDERIDRLIESQKRPITQIYNDRRQININGGV